MAISTAVTLERAARAVGYALDIGNFRPGTPYLPQRILMLSPANEDKQTDLTSEPIELTGLDHAAKVFGYGSPAYGMMRILKPLQGGGIGGIPVIAYPQLDSDITGATTAERSWSATVETGADANETHYIKVNGRTNVDGQFYKFTVNVDDDGATIVGKIVDAINNVIGAPCTATADTETSGSELAVITSKFTGVIGEDLKIEFVTGDNNANVTYAEDSSTEGAGEHDISDALASFGSDWRTIVMNPYGTTQHETLEMTNGDPVNRTGLYAGTVWKPFMAIWGSTLSTVSSVTEITDADARKDQVTNVLAPAPESDGWPFEAVANVTRLLAVNCQNTPHRDIDAKTYPDMPFPEDGDIGDFSDYDKRDQMLKKGASIVSSNSGKYQVESIVTTYHPDGEIDPAYRYARDLMLDFNVKFADTLLVEEQIRDLTIIGSDQVSTVGGTIKPVEARQLTASLIDDLATLALIVDPQFSKDSIQAQVSSTNPKRLDRSYPYKRSSTAKIVSTTVTAGFAYALQ